MIRSLPRWLKWSAELVLLSALAGVSFTVAHRYLATAAIKSIVEWELAPAVVVACGGGFQRPEIESPALQGFLLRHTATVSCDEVAGPTVTPLPVARGERYSIYAAGWAMRAGGMSWATLDAYFASLFAFSMALAYGIFRFAAGPLLASAGVIGLVWSSQVLALGSFRDFGKQPAFFALWLGLAWLLKRSLAPSPQRLVMPAVVTGGLLGVGIGFRIDAMIFLPVFVAVIAVVAPRFDLAGVKAKGIALGAFLLAFVSAGWPVLGSTSEGSNSAHVVVMGLMATHTRELGLAPTAYDLGDTSSDAFVYALIATHANTSRQAAAPLYLGTPEYDSAGTGLLADVARHFPADLLTRALAATAQAIAAPFETASRSGYLNLVPSNPSPWFLKVGEWRDAALAWPEGRSLWLAVVVLMVVASRNWRLGLLLAALLLYFGGYSMLQFSRRHTFHLDVIGIGLALAAVQMVADAGRSRLRLAGSRPPRPRPNWIRGIALVLGITVVIVGVLAGVRWWQQGHVRGLIERTLAADWEDARPVAEPLAASMLLNGEPRATWRVMPGFEPQRWIDGTLFRVTRPTGPGGESLSKPDIQAEYMRVALSAGCGVPVVTAVAAYTGAEATLQREYTRAFDVPVIPGRTSHVMMPVFYFDGTGVWTNFDGIAVPSGQAACVTAVERAASPYALPFPLLSVMLRPDWQDQRWYQYRP